MLVMPVQWAVRQFLERHEVSPYRLMKESGLAQGTVYRLVNGETSNLNTDTLDRVIGALRRLTGVQVEVADLLQYEDPE